MVSLDRFGANTALAQVARVLTVVFSIAGTIILPFVAWMSHEAYLSFAALGESVHRTELAIASYETLRVQRNAEIAALNDGLKEQSRVLWDHEKRMARIEATPAPLRRQQPPPDPGPDPTPTPPALPPPEPPLAIQRRAIR